MKTQNRQSWMRWVKAAFGVRPAASAPPPLEASEIPTSLLEAWEELNRPLPEPGPKDSPSQPRP